LRSDIDALPIVERTGLSYASTHDGPHARCGHDGHTATLVGTGRYCKQMVRDLPVCVKFIWQPAEEGGGGGEILCDAGVLDGRVGPKSVGDFGVARLAGLKVGTVATKPGELLAATDTFTRDVRRPRVPTARSHTWGAIQSSPRVKAS
jgi:hippurate hydrolase